MATTKKGPKRKRFVGSNRHFHEVYLHSRCFHVLSRFWILDDFVIVVLLPVFVLLALLALWDLGSSDSLSSHILKFFSCVCILEIYRSLYTGNEVRM